MGEPQTFKVRATAVLIEKGCILLVEQHVSAVRGWSLPGGTLEAGETLETCIVREMEEETGLRVAVDKLLYICDRIGEGRHVVHITFAVRQVGGTLRLGCEPEPAANPIHSVKMVSLVSLAEYGFSQRFCELARKGFPGSGTYAGLISNIGL